MSDTRYPTRMHKVLGVETFERFQIKGLTGHFFLTAAGQICQNEAGIDNDYIIDAINNGIIHLPPPLTDEQREQLKAIWTLGYRWLVKDMTGDAFAFGFKPVKHSDWMAWMLSPDDKNEMVVALNKDLNVCSLVSWSDPEPLDIVATLKAAGVEVEK